MFRYTHRVHFSDTDVTGWTYYSKPLEWMEWCRSDFFRQRFGDLLDLSKQTNVSVFPASVRIDYKRPIYFDEEVEIQLMVKEIHPYSFIFYYELFCQGQKVIVAEMNMVTADVHTNRLARIPESVKELLREHLLPA